MILYKMTSKSLVFNESEYNINYGFKDLEHIDLLKTQILQGDDIPIYVYRENGSYKVIDGGHTLRAYRELGLQPVRVIEKHFDNDVDKIAFSRHRNLIRLKQSPVSLTKSIVKELQLRLCVDRNEVLAILRRYSNLVRQENRYVRSERDNHNARVIEELFSKEPIKAVSFVQNYLPLLDLPDWLAEQVDLQVITASHAKLINKLSTESEQRRVVQAVKDRVLTVRETRNLVDKMNEGLGIKEWWSEEEYFSQTLWDIRHSYLDSQQKFVRTLHPCPYLPIIPFRLIRMYTKPGDTVLDPFCGAATTSIAARELGRHPIGIDISQEYVERAKERLSWNIPSDSSSNVVVMRGDATGLDLNDECIDFVCTSPPYYSAIDYEIEEGNNVGRDQPYSEYLTQMKLAISEMYRVLKPDGYCCIVVSRMKENGRCYWIAADLYRIGEEVGFTFVEYKVLRLMAWNYVDFVLVFKKY